MTILSAIGSRAEIWRWGYGGGEVDRGNYIETCTWWKAKLTLVDLGQSWKKRHATFCLMCARYCRFAFSISTRPETMLGIVSQLKLTTALHWYFISSTLDRWKIKPASTGFELRMERAERNITKLVILLLPNSILVSDQVERGQLILLTLVFHWSVLLTEEGWKAKLILAVEMKY